MRRLGALCLSIGLVGPALAADPPPAEEPSWFRRWVLGERTSKPAPEAATAKDKPAPAPKDPPQPAAATPAPRTREAVAKALAEEQRLYLERLQAISKIKRVADERGDDDLMRKAEELEVQAEELFRQRTARLPRPEDLPDDRAALERGRDTRPATAQRPTDRRPSTRGSDR